MALMIKKPPPLSEILTKAVTSAMIKNEGNDGQGDGVLEAGREDLRQVVGENAV